MKQTCKICGCTDTDPCYHPKLGLCWWVADDLCSHCQKELTGEIPASSVTHCVNSSNEVEFSSNPSDEKKE